MQDKKLVCKDCGEEFEFSEAEQRFYQERNLSEPKRCKACRDKKRANNEKNDHKKYAA